MTRPSLFTAAATALALVATGPLHAQSDTPSETGQNGTETAVPDPLLTAFVTAALGVDTVVQTYRPQMEAAEDAATRESVGEEAQLAMIAAIEETDGITVEEYLAIAESARTDEALNERVVRRYEELTATE